MTATAGLAGGGRTSQAPDPFVRALRVVVVLVVAIEAADNARYLWRRFRRQGSGWWERLEQRDSRQLHRAELGMLVRRLPSR